MKNINSKKARAELGTLINDLAFNTEASADVTNDGTESLYWQLKSAQTIIKLHDVYGIPNIHYKSSLWVAKNKLHLDTVAVMHKRADEWEKENQEK